MMEAATPIDLNWKMTVGEEFPRQLKSVVESFLEKEGWAFTCQNEVFESEEMAAPDGLLPMWCHQAQSMMRRALGDRMAPMLYRLNAEALCGAEPEPPEQSVSVGVWAVFIHFAMEDTVKNALVPKGEPVPVDSLYESWVSALQARQVPLLPPKMASTLGPGLEGVKPGNVQEVEPRRGSSS